MGLILFHLKFSAVCFFTAAGFMFCCKDTMIKNGWIDKNDKVKARDILATFVPILNFLIVVCLVLATISKKDEQ